MSLRLLAAATAGALAAFTADAFAHAIVVASTPAAHATVAGPAADISVRFNSRIDPRRSVLRLVGPKGAVQPLAFQADDPPVALTAKATGLGAGAWQIYWQVLSVDGHITRGYIPFSVR